MTLNVVDKITVNVSYKRFIFKKSIILNEGTYYKTKFGPVKLEIILMNDDNIIQLMITHRGKDLNLISEWMILDEFMTLFNIMPGEYTYTIDKNYILHTVNDSNIVDISNDLKINDQVIYTVIDKKGRVMFYGNGEIQNMWIFNNRISACIIGGVEFYFTSTGLLMENSCKVMSKYDDERKLVIRKI